MRRSWVQFTMSYLLIVAAMGVWMRTMPLSLSPLPNMPYDHILHAHSHVAILGWGYMALVLLLIKMFLPSGAVNGKQLRLLYGITQLAIAGMLISFLLQGYALFSIAFSTLHILLSYWLAVYLWRRVSGTGGLSVWFLRGSLVSLAVSSIGPWSLAVLSANQLQGSDWYNVAIYFYLHFQYNGWLTLGLIAVLLRFAEKRKIPFSTKLLKAQFGIYMISLLPAFLSSVLWIKVGAILEVIAAAATIAEWTAVVMLVLALLQVRKSFTWMFGGVAAGFLWAALFALFLKSTMSLGTIVPGLADMIYASRSIVIGYLHLTLLGFISFLCISLFLQLGWISGEGGATKLGLGLLAFGFVLNELVLFLSGLWGWLDRGSFSHASEWLWLASVLMAAGVALIRVRKERKTLLEEVPSDEF